MTKKTINDVYILVARIEERQLSVIEKLEDSKEWQTEHEKKDEERFSNLNKYAASVAAVAGCVGACSSYIWKKINGA